MHLPSGLVRRALASVLCIGVAGVVCALGGNDFVHGGPGLDLCAGGAGDDNVSDTCEADG